MATDRHINFITALVSNSAHDSNIDAINAYGFGLRTARDLSDREASEMIDWLQGKPHHASLPAAPIAKTSCRPATNKGGRVGQIAHHRDCGSATVVSDNGKRVQIRFADGSIGGFDAAKLTFS